MPYIPDSVFESGTWEKLSPNSRLVYVALCKFYNRKDKKAFPGVSRIMQVSGCSRRSVFRALNELKEKGLIVIKKKDSTSGFDSNMYILLDFLFFELNQTKIASARQALASDIQALLSATTDKPLVPDSHTNYIINHITNIDNSFNSKDAKMGPEGSQNGTLNKIEVIISNNNNMSDKPSFSEKDKEGIRAYARLYGVSRARTFWVDKGYNPESIQEILEGMEGPKFSFRG
jgi:hypothetical protein